MESKKDEVAETIDYINQVEKEILYSLEQNTFHCDNLLDKVSQDLYMTLSLERDIHDRTGNAFDENVDTFEEERSYPAEESSPNYLTDTSTLAFEIDKQSNYRYSFYDNSNLFLVYLTHSTLIDQHMSQLGTSEEKVESALNAIQKENHGLLLPPYVEDSLIHLFKLGLNSVGLFRKSGVKSRINSLKEQVKNGERICFDSCSLDDIADLVKTWLRGLRPHLISKEMVEAYLSDRENFTLWTCGDSHRYLLFVILKFLSIVCSCSQQNQMTSHNLAICFAPSLCECDSEDQITNAQSCLKYCIDNHSSLFYVNITTSHLNQSIKLNHHTSDILVGAGSQDILNRILYERHQIDPLINKWAIKSQSENKDTIEYNLCFSSFLPAKPLTLHRNWTIQNKHCTILDEKGDLFKSRWKLEPHGKGQTRVVHDLTLDLRGFSSAWYEQVFSVIHDSQLKRLASTFEFIKEVKQAIIISKV